MMEALAVKRKGYWNASWPQNKPASDDAHRVLALNV